LEKFINTYVKEITETNKFKDFYLANEGVYFWKKEDFWYSYKSVFDFLKVNHKESLEKMEYILLSFLFFYDGEISQEEFNSNVDSVINGIIDPDEIFYLKTLEWIVNDSDFDCFKEGEKHYTF